MYKYIYIYTRVITTIHHDYQPLVTTNVHGLRPLPQVPGRRGRLRGHRPAPPGAGARRHRAAAGARSGVSVAAAAAKHNKNGGDVMVMTGETMGNLWLNSD